MAESAGCSKDRHYELPKNPDVDWKRLFEETAGNLFLEFLEAWQRSDGPSFRSRPRIRLVLDDTSARRWSLHVANTFNSGAMWTNTTSTRRGPCS